MSGVRTLAQFTIILCVWPILVVGLGYLVLTKYPSRLPLASSAGIATVLSVLLMLIESTQSLDASFCIVAAIPGFAVFLVALLGTYIAPAREGTTFEEYFRPIIKSRMHQVKTRKDDDAENC